MVYFLRAILWPLFIFLWIIIMVPLFIFEDRSWGR